MRHGMYRNEIRETLAKQGNVGIDPALVEAWMRLECGTLDGLDRTAWDNEVAVAAACVKADPAASASLAASMGLVR